MNTIEKYRNVLKKNNILCDISDDFIKYNNTVLEISKTELKSIGYVFAPTVLLFTTWVLQDAIEKNRKRLYFLARDGYLFYLCAKKLNEALELGIDCRYLECSRYSIRIPLMANMGKKALKYICIGGIDVTFRKVMGRASLSEKETLEVAKQLNYDNIDGILSYKEVNDLKKPLADCKYFMNLLKEKSEKAYNAAIAYFEQQGLFENVEYALVDSGWVGSMQVVIRDLLRTKAPDRNIKGYYFGLYEIPPEEKETDYNTYYFNIKKDYRRKMYFSNCLFETVFSSPKGMTIGYSLSKDAGRVSCRYETEKSGNAKKITEQSQLIDRYVNISIEYIDSIYDIDVEKGKKILYGIYKIFMGNPDDEEAAIYGNYRFSDDVVDNDKSRLAKKMTKAELKSNFLFSKLFSMYGIRKETVHESAWYEAAATISGVNAKRYNFHYRLYKLLIYFRKEFKSRKRK